MADVHKALALRRATGAPLLGLLLDLRQATTAGPAAIALEGLSAWGPLGVTEVATLSDLALGAAIRRTVGTATLLPTLTLTLELDHDGRGCDATVRAEAEPTVGAVGRLRSADGLVGRCMATFVVGSREADVPPLPWEIDARPSASALPRVHEERLTDAEAAVLAALEPASGGSLEARLLRLHWQTEDGRSQGTFEPGLALRQPQEGDAACAPSSARSTPAGRMSPGAQLAAVYHPPQSIPGVLDTDTTKIRNTSPRKQAGPARARNERETGQRRAAAERAVSERERRAALVGGALQAVQRKGRRLDSGRCLARLERESALRSRGSCDPASACRVRSRSAFSGVHRVFRLAQPR